MSRTERLSLTSALPAQVYQRMAGIFPFLNAVVRVRFATSVLMGGAVELLAYGTAVVLGDE